MVVRLAADQGKGNEEVERASVLPKAATRNIMEFVGDNHLGTVAELCFVADKRNLKNFDIFCKEVLLPAA